MDQLVFCLRDRATGEIHVDTEIRNARVERKWHLYDSYGQAAIARAALGFAADGPLVVTLADDADLLRLQMAEAGVKLLTPGPAYRVCLSWRAVERKRQAQEDRTYAVMGAAFGLILISVVALKCVPVIFGGGN